MKRKLKDSEKDVERLKQQLKQYVMEVKRAEDLLMEKVCSIVCCAVQTETPFYSTV